MDERQAMLAIEIPSPSSALSDTPVSKQARSLASELEGVLSREPKGSPAVGVIVETGTAAAAATSEREEGEPEGHPVDPRSMMSQLPLGVAPVVADDEQEAAAAHIQAVRRGKLARRDLAQRAERLKQQKIEEEQKEKEAARKKKRNRNKSSSKASPSRSRNADSAAAAASLGLDGSPAEDAAATKLQSIQRGKQTRRQVQEQKEQTSAATKIQARHRGKMTRRRQAAMAALEPEPGPDPEVTEGASDSIP
jgi:hypothetical protein